MLIKMRRQKECYMVHMDQDRLIFNSWDRIKACFQILHPLLLERKTSVQVTGVFLFSELRLLVRLN